jgi:hypothetical protein
MKKYILILLLFTGFLQSQTLTNPTFGNTTTNTLKIKTPATVASVNFLSTNEADGSISKIEPINVNIPYTPSNYSVSNQSIGQHLTGIDTRLGQISSTTAGITQRVYFTADNTTVTAGTFFTSSLTGKGSTATGSPPALVLADNTKGYFSKDIISVAFPDATIGYAGSYTGQLTVSATPTPVATQQRFTVEIYRTNNGGTPIASGVSGAPTGDLGVTVVAILDSGILNLTAGSITNIPITGILTQNITLNTGERLRYHVSAAKIGSGGGNVTFGVYYGSSYNSYYDVPVAITTDAVLNKSTASGITATDALNTINTALVYKKTIAQIRALSGTLPSNNFYTIDKNQEGDWYYDASDTTSPDNLGTVLVTSDGKRIKRILKDYVSIEWFGAIGDNSTDNVSAINNTIAFVYANPQYKVFIPGKQFFTSPISLPPVPTTQAGFKTIEIYGSNMANQLFGTQGDYLIGNTGSILRTSSTANPLIHCVNNASGYPFSFIKLVIRDLTLRTYQNPQISALSAGNAAQLIVENVQIDTDKYSVTTAEPTYTNSTGLITPYNDNGALTKLDNVSISGYYNGVEVNEHTDGSVINLTSTKVALLFKTANHSSHFKRVDAQRNVTVTKFVGNHTTKIEELNMEYRDPSSPFEDPAHAWQNTIYDVDDSSNFGKGIIYWANVKGYSGPDNKFVKNGGVNVQTYSLRQGAETLNSLVSSTIESKICLDISSTNLNDLDRQGDFRGVTMTNAPDTGFWYITSLIFDSSFKKQTATALGAGNSYPSGTIFERVKVSGSWGNWVQMATKLDLRPYKVYTALITQTGTSAPTATVLENNTGYTFTYAYSTTGTFGVNSSTSLPDGKTAIFITNGGNSTNSTMSAIYASGTITIRTVNQSTNILANGLLERTTIEIRIYP